jgi:hypothetical protein
MHERLFTVRWILAPADPAQAGLCGTTTHSGSTPAAAAISAARSISVAAPSGLGPAQLLILSVAEDDRSDVMTADALLLAVRSHPSDIPFEIVYRRLS